MHDPHLHHAPAGPPPPDEPPGPGPAPSNRPASSAAPRSDTELVAELRSLLGPAAPTEVDGLRDRLAARADDAGLLDVAYRTVDSPIGPLLVAATDRGVVRIAFGSEGHDAVLAALAATVSPRILRSGRRTDDAARQLEEYFAGRRRSFELAVDLRLSGGFRRQVLAHLLEIPYGRTETYASVARAAGNARAVRAAGSACARNPVPVVVPCHRVVRSDGTIGQYLGGTDTKRALLAMERSAA